MLHCWEMLFKMTFKTITGNVIHIIPSFFSLNVLAAQASKNPVAVWWEVKCHRADTQQTLKAECALKDQLGCSDCWGQNSVLCSQSNDMCHVCVFAYLLNFETTNLPIVENMAFFHVVFDSDSKVSSVYLGPSNMTVSILFSRDEINSCICWWQNLGHVKKERSFHPWEQHFPVKFF